MQQLLPFLNYLETETTMAMELCSFAAGLEMLLNKFYKSTGSE
jgi:hypothetical protein